MAGIVSGRVLGENLAAGEVGLVAWIDGGHGALLLLKAPAEALGGRRKAWTGSG